MVALGRLMAFRWDGTLHYVHTDHLGSSRITTDSSGNLVSQVWYYPYGGLGRSAGDGLATTYSFTGQRMEENRGLMYYGARYYDPMLGRPLLPQCGRGPKGLRVWMTHPYREDGTRFVSCLRGQAPRRISIGG